MMNRQNKIISSIGIIALLIGLIALTGCGESQRQRSVIPDPVIIANGEECDLCGMYINRFPGPKGQVFERGLSSPKRFCSTRDLFAYILQPEHQHRAEHVFVHDVATAAWESQGKATYIKAKDAFFVTGHTLKGAMGPALASFAKQADAQAFSHQHGGKVIVFSEVDIELLNSMSHQTMGHHSMDNNAIGHEH